MYDVCIIGAGPAGATLARLIGQKLKVLVIDKRSFSQKKENNFKKCCGGLIAPDAQIMFVRFGLGIPKEILVGPQLFAVRTIDIQKNTERFYQRYYMNVDREKFDGWLVQLIPSSVTIKLECVFNNYEEKSDRIIVHYNQYGKKHSEEAKILVSAEGAFSIIRNKILKKDRIKKYIAIQEWFHSKNTPPYFSAVFDPDITDFYSWTIPKDDFLILGAALETGKNPLEKFELLKKKLSKLGYQLSHCMKKNGAFLLRPEKIKDLYTGKNNIALIGEAAGFISPSSAEGYSYAFKSVNALSESLLNEPKQFLKKYNKNSRNLKRNIILKNIKSPFLYHPTLRNLIMKSGIKSLKPIGE